MGLGYIPNGTGDSVNDGLGKVNAGNCPLSSYQIRSFGDILTLWVKSMLSHPEFCSHADDHDRL